MNWQLTNVSCKFNHDQKRIIVSCQPLFMSVMFVNNQGRFTHISSKQTCYFDVRRVFFAFNEQLIWFVVWRSVFLFVCNVFNLGTPHVWITAISTCRICITFLSIVLASPPVYGC